MCVCVMSVCVCLCYECVCLYYECVCVCVCVFGQKNCEYWLLFFKFILFNFYIYLILGSHLTLFVTDISSTCATTCSMSC